jgi:hypothetical protein
LREKYGSYTEPLLRALLHEYILRLVFEQKWLSKTTKMIPLRVDVGPPFIAGSAGLHQYVGQTEGIPDWFPGDQDLFYPTYGRRQNLRAVCWTAETSLLLLILRMIPGIVIDTSTSRRRYRRSAVDEYDQPLIMHVTNLTISMPKDCFGSRRATPDLKVMKLSLIPVARTFVGHGGIPMLGPHDIMKNFDINVCQVAMQICPKTGYRDFSFGATRDDEAAIKHAIKQRRATILRDDKPNLPARQEKYEHRKFAFFDQPEEQPTPT